MLPCKQLGVRNLLLLISIIFLAGCVRTQPTLSTTTKDTDAVFARLADDFLAGYLAWRPQSGTALGLHEYDGKMTDYRRASLDAELARLRSFDERLLTLNAADLSPQPFHEYRLLQAAIRKEIFRFVDREVYTQNPMTYAGALNVNIYIKRDFAPLPQRVKSIITILQQAPKLTAAARANLATDLARPFVETAMEVAQGSADFLAKDWVEALKDFKEEPLRAQLTEANDRAVEELRNYVAWLKAERLPKAHERYAIGREKYAKMLRDGEFITLSPETILEIGLRELKREQAIFAQTAALIDPSRKPIEVFKQIQKDHPTAENL